MRSLARRLCQCVALLATSPVLDAAFCQRKGGKAAVTCEGGGATKKCWPSEDCAKRLNVQEKARKCVEEHCGTGERKGLKAWGPMCLDRCRATLWRATARQLVAPVIEDSRRLPLVMWGGDLWHAQEPLPPHPIRNASSLGVQIRRIAFAEALEKNYVSGMGRKTGGGWFDRGSPLIYEKTGGPLVLYGLQRSGTNALTGLVSAHLGTEVYNGERDDEYYERRAPRLSPTRYNDPRWKHFRPTHVSRLNSTHVLYASPHSTTPHLFHKEMTPLEERSGYGAEARPANVGDDREAFYARSARDLDALIKAEACFRKGALCGVDVQVRAYIIGVRHPGAWLDSLHRHCPDCPLSMRGTRAKAVWHAPGYYSQLWDATYTKWLEMSQAKDGRRIVIVRNEDITRSCDKAVQSLAWRLGLRYDASKSTKACSANMDVDMTLSGGLGPQDKESLERGDGWLFGLAGSREALEAILQINAQTMKSLGYPKQPLAKFVTASLEMTSPMYQWFLEAWDKVAKDRSGEAVSPTCDNLSEKVQKARRAWWMKPDYASTHPKTREDYLMLQHAADYVSPVARLDREKTSSTKNVALAALVRDACAAFTCNVRMVDALIGQASSLEFKVYILEDGSSDCTPQVLERWIDSKTYVHAVPPPPSDGKWAWDESMKGAYALRRDEALRQKRYARMALLRNHLTSCILKHSQVDAIVVYDADQGSGWASSNIVNAISAVIDGRYDAVCGNGIIAQAQQDRFIHRDLLALRFSDFEDQPSGGVELAPSESPSSESDRRFSSGGRRVASCFGGLAIYDSAIFRDDGCTYDYSASDGIWDCEHVLLNKCLASKGRSLTLLPNLIINGPYATGRRAKVVHLRRPPPPKSHHKHEF